MNEKVPNVFITEDEVMALYYPESITKANYDKTIEKISGRINYILRTLNPKLKWWDFDDIPMSHGEFCENGGGHFDPKLYGTFVSFVGEGFQKDFQELEMMWERFPTRWIWSEFEPEYKQMLADEAARKAAEAEKRKLKASKGKNVKETIKKKLTREELKAIKFV